MERRLPLAGLAIDVRSGSRISSLASTLKADKDIFPSDGGFCSLSAFSPRADPSASALSWISRRRRYRTKCSRQRSTTFDLLTA